MVLGCAADGKVENYWFHLSELWAKAAELPIAGTAKCVRSACTPSHFPPSLPFSSRPAQTRRCREPANRGSGRGGSRGRARPGPARFSRATPAAPARGRGAGSAGGDGTGQALLTVAAPGRAERRGAERRGGSAGSARHGKGCAAPPGAWRCRGQGTAGRSGGVAPLPGPLPGPSAALPGPLPGLRPGCGAGEQPGLGDWSRPAGAPGAPGQVGASRASGAPSGAVPVPLPGEAVGGGSCPRPCGLGPSEAGVSLPQVWQAEGGPFLRERAPEPRDSSSSRPGPALPRGVGY